MLRASRTRLLTTIWRWGPSPLQPFTGIGDDLGKFHASWVELDPADLVAQGRPPFRTLLGHGFFQIGSAKT